MNKDPKARFVDGVFIVVVMAFVLLVMYVLLEVFAPAAQARELRVIYRQDVPTVVGIEAAPSPSRYYRRPVTVHTGPSAGVYDLGAPAPANACGPHAFEVISGPRAERGCYGH